MRISRRLAIVAGGVVAAVILTVLSASAGASVNPDTNVNTYGKPFCQPNGWVWLDTVPAFKVHDSEGACVEAPDKRKPEMTVTAAQTASYTYPHMSSGFDLGESGCPTSGTWSLDRTATPGAMVCPPYPDRVDGNWDPMTTVSAWNAPGQYNLSFDMWFSHRRTDVSYQNRCSADPSKAHVEVMVWLAHTYYQVPDRGGNYSTVIGGRRWRVYAWTSHSGCPRGEGWPLIIFMAPRITSGTVLVHNLKLNDFWAYSIRHGWLRNSEWNTAIDLGWEIIPGYKNGVGNKITDWRLWSGRYHTSG